MSYKVVSHTQTCFACPSQWEGKLDDGRMVYIRYRWGSLDVRVSSSQTEDIMEAVKGESILEEDLGDGLSGVISFEELKIATKDILEWPEVDDNKEIE